MTPENAQALVGIFGGAVATTLLGGIWKGVSNINTKIENILVSNQEHKSVGENHKRQLSDLWDKTAQIDKHLQENDKDISALQERTKKL